MLLLVLLVLALCIGCFAGGYVFGRQVGFEDCAEQYARSSEDLTQLARELLREARG